jgi:Zinc knuckle
MGDSERDIAPPGVENYAREIAAQQEAEELRRASGTSGAGEASSSSGSGSAAAPAARQNEDDGIAPPALQTVRDSVSEAGQPRNAGVSDAGQRSGTEVVGGANLTTGHFDRMTTGHFDRHTSHLATNQMGVPAPLPRMYPPLQANLEPQMYPPEHRFSRAEYELEGLRSELAAMRAALTQRANASVVNAAPQSTPRAFAVTSIDSRNDVDSESSGHTAARRSGALTMGARNGEAIASAQPLRPERTYAQERAIREQMRDISTYCGTKNDNLEKFIREANYLRRDYDMTDEEMYKILLRKTDLAARDCLESMEDAEKYNFKAVVAKLRMRFGVRVSRDSFGAEMQKLSQGKFQSVREYFSVADNLRMRQEKWFRETEGEAEAKNTRSMRNSNITSCFRAGLQPELLRQIAGEDCDDLEELFWRLLKIEEGLAIMRAAEKREQYNVSVVWEAPIMQVANQNGAFPKGTCYICGNPDHWANTCPQRTEKAAKPAGNNISRSCFICRDQTHTIANCPNRFCQLCSRIGHWQYECILKQQQSDNTNQTQQKNL